MSDPLNLQPSTPEDDIFWNLLEPKLLEPSTSEDDIFWNLLESELLQPYRVRFVPYPYYFNDHYLSSSSYVTINGNEETCGSSFSDQDSTFMASLDSRGVVVFDGACGLTVPVVREDMSDGWEWNEVVLAASGFLAEH